MLLKKEHTLYSLYAMNKISSTLTGEIYTKKHKSGVTNIFIGEKETVSKIKKKENQSTQSTDISF